jgi:hypothetical protein
MTEPERPPFDRVVVRIEGREASLNVAEFLRMQFHDRICAILTGGLAFYDGNRRVDTQAALDALRRLSIDARTS